MNALPNTGRLFALLILDSIVFHITSPWGLSSASANHACQNKTNGSHPAHPAVGSCKMHRPHCELESSCPVCFGSCKLQHLVLDGRIEPDKTRQSKRKGDMVFYPFLLKANRGPTVSYGTCRPWLLTTIPSQKMILQARCPSAIRQGLHHAEMDAKPVMWPKSRTKPRKKKRGPWLSMSHPGCLLVILMSWFLK